jgi:hypothetical protein
MDTLESDHAMDGQSSTPEHEHRTQAPESSENKNTHCMMHYSEPRVLNVQRSTHGDASKKIRRDQIDAENFVLPPGTDGTPVDCVLKYRA